MRKREANYELLRIVAMLMIITLHYLDKGGILPQPESAYTGAGLTAWVLEAFCNEVKAYSCSCFVLLGYRLQGSDHA